MHYSAPHIPLLSPFIISVSPSSFSFGCSILAISCLYMYLSVFIRYYVVLYFFPLVWVEESHVGVVRVEYRVHLLIGRVRQSERELV